MTTKTVKAAITAVVAIAMSGCAATPEKLDVGTLPMPAPQHVERTAGAIWQGPAMQNRLYSDFRARDVGDIITVAVIDSTAAKKEATTAVGSSSNENIAVSDVFGMPLSFGMSNFGLLGNKFNPSVSGTRTHNYDGDGATERKGTITATITVRVTDVLQNGNLYVEGRKDTTVNKEDQQILLSGIIRPVDVSANNTIMSDKISDLKIVIAGKGVVADKQRPGWLSRLLDKGWPL
jgi:flagellar L-ring protein precursor FlgH